MNANRLILRTGIMLFLGTIAIFFALYFAFSTQGNITEAEYFNYSAFINCFLLPAFYAGSGFYSIYRGAKIRPLTFGQGWKLAFLPQFTGGLVSLVFIFVFFNTSGSWAEDSLQRGWYDLMTASPNPEFMEKNGEMVKAMTNPEINMFTWKTFFISFSVILFFYFLISSIFAVFLKNRKI